MKTKTNLKKMWSVLTTLYSNNSTESDHKISSTINDSGNVISDEQSICNAFNIF